MSYFGVGRPVVIGGSKSGEVLLDARLDAAEGRYFAGVTASWVLVWSASQVRSQVLICLTSIFRETTAVLRALRESSHGAATVVCRLCGGGGSFRCCWRRWSGPRRMY